MAFGTPSRDAVATQANLPGRNSCTSLGMLTMVMSPKNEKFLAMKINL